MTAEEGFLEARRPSEYLAEYGISYESQEKMWLDRKVNPTPLNKDNRVKGLSI